MDANVIQILIQGGAVGITMAVIFGIYHIIQRALNSGDTRFEGSQEIVKLLIASTNRNADSHDDLAKSIDKNTQAVTEMHTFMKNLNGSLKKTVEDKQKDQL